MYLRGRLTCSAQPAELTPQTSAIPFPRHTLCTMPADIRAFLRPRAKPAAAAASGRQSTATARGPPGRNNAARHMLLASDHAAHIQHWDCTLVLAAPPLSAELPFAKAAARIFAALGRMEGLRDPLRGRWEIHQMPLHGKWKWRGHGAPASSQLCSAQIPVAVIDVDAEVTEEGPPPPKRPCRTAAAAAAPPRGAVPG
eukprot:gene23409-biopygen11832